MKQLHLSRDYDVPKRAMFLLDGMEMVQSSDSVAFVSSTVTDNIMYSTNGNLGLRHCSEVETCAFQTNVILNGVYHLVSRETMVECRALSREKQTGATICSVDLDFIIDGESGTLSSIPGRRLSLANGSYTSFCEDVMSPDGGLMFNTSYTRTVGTSEMDLWTAEVVHDHFRIVDGVDTDMDESWSRPISSPYRMSKSFDSVGIKSSNNVSYRAEITVSFAVQMDEWEILKADKMDSLWQRSLSSNVTVNTTTSVSCVVEYEDGTTASLIPDQDMQTKVVDEVDGEGSHTYYAPNIYAKNNASELFAISTEEQGNTGKRYKQRKGPDTATSSTKETPKKFLIKKRFLVNISKGDVPKKMTLTFQARHTKGNTPASAEFPSMVSIIEEKQRHLAPFWENFNVDLQLQDELTPNRTRLSLLYNAFRLFEVSQNLENGLAASGYSVSGDGLLYRLCDYIFFCLYYIATAPDCALQLIKSLHKMLAVCRKNAEDLCLPGGAVFPMVTIKGTNCRSYSNYNNTRLPINAYIGKMIAAFFAAVEAVSEEDRLLLMELMLETARVWLSMGEWVEGRTYFRLENIAGADEYNSSVSGNFFIHLSAKDHLNRAVDLLTANEKLLGTEKIDALLEKINMTREELEEMKEASKAIVVRKSDRLGIYMVHDYFDKLATWKGGAQHPLSSNYHPLAIYRHKVVDLPEVLMGLLLHDTLFEPTDFEQNYNYYLPLCTFDSPESMGIFAISQCRARGEFAQPIPFLKSLANLDLDDIIYSADEGLHFGSMALSLNTLIYGLGGVSFADGQLFVSPILPAGVASLRFSVCFRGCVLSVVLNEKELVYELKSGDSLRFIHGQQRLRVHLHTKYRRFEALSKMVIPRASFSLVSQFDGAVFLADSLFLNLYEYNYVSWYRVLETLFDTYRALQNKTIAPLSPHEFIQKVVYQTESSEIAFSGIHNILLSRGIDLELGTPDDAEIVETRYGLANAKLAEMTEMLEKDPPQINPELYHLLQSLETNKISMAIVTYSRSLKQLMSSDAHNLSRYFITHIDGEEAHDRHIKSRPHVDLYLRAAEKLHVVPERCLVFAHHLDRDYAAEEMARFRMFLDIEDPFVSSREELSAYPTLSEEYCEKHNRDNPVVCRLLLNKMPSTVNHLEDVVDGL